jgi:hypothetical protein
LTGFQKTTIFKTCWLLIKDHFGCSNYEEKDFWIRELNCRPLLFEGTTPIFSGMLWRPVLDVPGWSRNGISGPGHNRRLQIQSSSADWGSSVQIFPRPGFHTMPAFPGGHSLTCRFCCGLQTTLYPESQDALGWKDKCDACFKLTQQLKKNTRSNRMVN